MLVGSGTGGHGTGRRWSGSVARHNDGCIVPGGKLEVGQEIFRSRGRLRVVRQNTQGWPGRCRRSGRSARLVIWNIVCFAAGVQRHREGRRFGWASGDWLDWRTCGRDLDGKVGHRLRCRGETQRQGSGDLQVRTRFRVGRRFSFWIFGQTRSCVRLRASWYQGVLEQQEGKHSQGAVEAAPWSGWF